MEKLKENEITQDSESTDLCLENRNDDCRIIPKEIVDLIS